MKKNKKEIKLLKALAFPVSAWFLFTIATTAIHAQETNVSNVENASQTVETTSAIDSSLDENGTQNTELNNKDKTMDDYWDWANQNIGTSNVDSSKQEKTDSVTYETHVQDIGWQKPKEDGEVAGTTGHSKKIEAIQIQLVEKGKTLNTGGISSIQKDASYINDNVATGWTTINGKKVYFNSKGKKVTGYQTIDGKTYCFKADGTLMTNTWTSECNYADADGVITETHLWAVNKKVEYIVDQEAYDALEPIYTMVEHDICNVCGADITNNVSSHSKAHALAGEGGGWHSGFVQTLTGYEMVHHEEEGHYEETILNKFCLRCGAKE